MNIKKLRELKKNKKGFTLIEIIVVVVILAVLLAVAVPSVMNYLGEADDAKYMANARAQMTEAQANIAKDYSKASNKSTWEVKNVTINLITANPAIASVKALPETANTPDKVTAIEVTFTDGTKATVTINDEITITPKSK